MNNGTEECNHIWHLESPSGKFSTGRCSECGEIKENFFCNVPDIYNSTLTNRNTIHGKVIGGRVVENIGKVTYLRRQREANARRQSNGGR